jgi:aspartyl-tRNA synthetase
MRKSDSGKEVILMGWVDTMRDHGGVIFIDLRDRYGKTQIVFNPEKNENVYDKAKGLKKEYVIGVKGIVVERTQEMVNPKIPTGEIEVFPTELKIFNKSKPLPFDIDDSSDTISEEIRLKYRYLDLRRPSMQRNLQIRHRFYQTVRRYFDELGFLEVETPMLMKSTPEGARDYLVPSRLFNGKFYALPQSPQTYKQILMVSGCDKYFQIVKCFRDEDLRADRQPEFTQIDIEMSFVEEENIYSVMEGLMIRVLKDIINVEVGAPFPRMTYQDAISKYGTDKPDLRWDLPIVDITEITKSSDFPIFKDVVEKNGIIAGVNLKGLAHISRSQIDELSEYAVKFLGTKGAFFIKLTEEGVSSSIKKYFPEGALNKIIEKCEMLKGDALMIMADKRETVLTALGNIRLEIIKRFNLPKKTDYVLLWVVDFPLLEFNEEENRFQAMHHPFTSPKYEDIWLLDKDPLKARARAYDLVLNGSEIAGGSIRIHDRQLQEKMFNLLNIGEEEAKLRFGFLLDAFEYGAPPHGGIAFGFDRIAMILSGAKSIREVIAFPKTNSAVSLMDGAPTEVSPEQLKELGIKIVR